MFKDVKGACMDGQDGRDWVGFEGWGGWVLEQKETLPTWVGSVRPGDTICRGGINHILG